jgi:pimeloyl-ACP methyl ester carboxylesterase
MDVNRYVSRVHEREPVYAFAFRGQVHLVGRSDGGIVALLVALGRPDGLEPPQVEVACLWVTPCLDRRAAVLFWSNVGD